jgi:LysM repeat protein
MLDFMKRLLVALIMALCIGLLFIGGRYSSAETRELENHTKGWIWPALGEITDYFGTRNGKHKGLDIAGPMGSPIFSVDDGVVSKSYFSSTYGHVVFIKHPKGFETVYAHLHKRLVHEGEHVKRGQQIGKLGNSGRSSGPHLHFEVHKGEWTYNKINAINPLTVLNDQSLHASLAEHTVDSSSDHSKSEKEVSDNQFENDRMKMLTKLKEGEYIHPETAQEIVLKVKVMKGQTLWELSQKHKVAIESLKKWNNLKSDLIISGQMIVIYPEREEVYVVKPGDSLPKIAKAMGKTVEEIKTINKLKNDFIYPNQILIIDQA